MRLLFVILAHDRPEDAAALARTLTEAGSDARALIHFDLRADPALFARLQAAVAEAPGVDLVRDRVATAWGEWGLVAAPLNALAQVEAGAAEWTPERVILLSGVCLPCRPVRQLERWLSARPEREFIEVRDGSWVLAGLRDERWSLHFPFNFRSQPFLHRWATRLQRWLGVRRRFPEGLTPRFGSQWWCLTWETCAKLLAWRRENPSDEAFFRRVWIPDEMVIQTLVHALVPAKRIHGGGLTHFQFTDRGVPVVYFDDHADYVPTLDAFFVRKVSPGATRLRAACLALAKAPADAGAPVSLDRRSTGDYALKIAAQAVMGGAGRAFKPDQKRPAARPVLALAAPRAVLLIGSDPITGTVAESIPSDRFAVLGDVLADETVDFGAFGDGFGGLTRHDAAIRDMHPALYLSRLIARAPRLPVIRWDPARSSHLLEAMLAEPHIIAVACLPRTGDSDDDLRAPGKVHLEPAQLEHAVDFLRVTVGHLTQAEAERIAIDKLGRSRFASVDGVTWLRTGPIDLSPDSRSLRAGVRATAVPLPWAPAEWDALAAERREAFDAGLARLEATADPDLALLAEALRAAWARPPFTHPPR